MASWGNCDFHELRDLNERIKAAASEPEMDAFYTGLLDEMMNGLLTDVKELTPVDRGHLRRNWFITKAKRSGKVYHADIYNNIGMHHTSRTATGRRSDGTFRPSVNVWFAVSLKESICCARVCLISRKKRRTLSGPKARNFSAA